MQAINSNKSCACNQSFPCIQSIFFNDKYRLTPTITFYVAVGKSIENQWCENLYYIIFRVTKAARNQIQRCAQILLQKWADLSAIVSQICKLVLVTDSSVHDTKIVLSQIILFIGLSLLSGSLQNQNKEIFDSFFHYF